MAASSVRLRNCVGIADGRQGVQIRDEIVSGRLVLQIDVLPDGAEIVAPVEAAGRLNAGENVHGRSGARVRD